MIDLALIKNFLDQKLNGVLFHIWVRQSNKTELSFGNEKVASLCLPDLPKADENNYTLSYQNKMTYMINNLEGNAEIIICFREKNNFLKDLEYDLLYNLMARLYYKELFKTKNNELDKIIESIQAITSTLDLEDLYKRIIKIALTVIPGGDAGVFRLYEAETNHLVPIATVGLDADYLYYKTKVGENISGKVFLEKSPKVYHSKEEILFDNNSKKHLNYVKSKNIANAMLVVPVILEEQCIGTMAILQFSKNKVFRKGDLQLLQGFSSQVAIAYKNAKLYNKANQRLKTVIQLSSELENKNQILQQRIKVHDTLTQLSLKNKGTKKIINEMGRILNLPTTYIDFFDNEIYSGRNSQLDLDYETISEIIKREHNSPIFTNIQGKEFYFYPIVIGNVLLGSIAVIFSNELSQMDIVTIEQSASVLSLELVKKISLSELQYKKTHEYFNKLLKGSNYDDLISTGPQFNFKFSSYSFVILCEILGSSEPYKTEVEIQRLLSKIHFNIPNINKLTYGLHNKITLLFSVSDLTSAKKVMYQLEKIIKEWEQSENQNLYGGIGTPYKNIEEIKKSYDEAIKALSFLTNRKKPGFVRYEDIGINRFFINYSNQEIKQFTEEIFSRLSYDNTKSHDLEKTLTVYISSSKSAIDTAKKLNIHINTLYQRLKRIEERLELSFDNPDDMLKIHLACHLKETFQ